MFPIIGEVAIPEAAEKYRAVAADQKIEDMNSGLGSPDELHQLSTVNPGTVKSVDREWPPEDRVLLRQHPAKSE